MLKDAYLLAKIVADTAENEQHFAEMLTKYTGHTSIFLNPKRQTVAGRAARGPRRKAGRRKAGRRGRGSGRSSAETLGRYRAPRGSLPQPPRILRTVGPAGRCGRASRGAAGT